MFLYVIGPDEGPQKIGFSKDVQKRLSNLQTGNPVELKIHYQEEVPENRVKLLENKIHRELNHHRINGEWFNINPNDAMLEVQHVVIRWVDDPLLGI